MAGVGARAADLTATGNLDIGGDADIRGTTFTLGSFTNDNTEPGVILTYTDAITSGTAAPSLLKFTANRPSHEWIWEHQNDTQTATVPTMKLDEDHRLSLFSASDSETPVIVLDPELGQIEIDGVPITASGGFSALTVGAGASATEGSIAIGPDATADFYSTAFGYAASATGYNSFAAGNNAIASENDSIAIGAATIASGGSSVAIGDTTFALNSFSIAIGQYTTASGINSTAMGRETKASGDSSTAMGGSTEASGDLSTAMGDATLASGDSSTAMGTGTIAAGDYQLAIGRWNIELPSNSEATDTLFIIGNGEDWTEPSNAFTVNASGDVMAAGNLSLGSFTRDVQGNTQSAVAITYTDSTEGVEPTPSLLKFTANRPSHEWIWEHQNTTQTATVPMMKLDEDHRLSLFSSDDPETPAIVLDPELGQIEIGGVPITASGGFSALTAGLGASADEWAIAVGPYASATGYSAAFGNQASASGDSFAAGATAVASGFNSTAIGIAVLASGNSSTALGDSTVASSYFSTAIGAYTTASGVNSTAIGWQTIASGYISTAMGDGTIASGDKSTAMGNGTIAAGDDQLAIGRWNIEVPSNQEATDTLFIIGNGSWNERSNAFTVNASGDVMAAGNVDAAGAISAAGGVTVTGTSQFNGTTQVNGSLIVSGTAGIIVSGTASKILINPQGDLAMGEFTAGATPQ